MLSQPFGQGDPEIGRSTLFRAWVDWWDRTRQHGHPGNETAFGIKLAEAYGFEKKRRTTGARTYYYKGLRRRTAEDDAREDRRRPADAYELFSPGPNGRGMPANAAVFLTNSPWPTSGLP